MHPFFSSFKEEECKQVFLNLLQSWIIIFLYFLLIYSIHAFEYLKQLFKSEYIDLLEHVYTLNWWNLYFVCVIDAISDGLPSKTLPDGSISKVSIVPFYDRTQLINETIGTLQEALTLEILITIIVVILMLLNLKSSFLVSGTLPVAVLMCFIAMKYFGVDANIVANVKTRCFLCYVFFISYFRNMCA